MSGPHDPGVPEPDAEDSALLAELRELLRPSSSPPASALDAARAVFTWRTVDAELAALAYDSLVDDAPATARAGTEPRILTFEADGLTVEVEVEESRGARRLLGQLVPSQVAALELRAGEEVVDTGGADELGRFVLVLPAEPRRLTIRVTPDGGTAVESAAVLL